MIKEMLVVNSYVDGIVNTSFIKKMYRDFYGQELSDQEALEVGVAMNAVGITPKDFYNPKPYNNPEGFPFISEAANAAK